MEIDPASETLCSLEFFLEYLETEKVQKPVITRRKFFHKIDISRLDL
jgi:hypothetical protein